MAPSGTITVPVAGNIIGGQPLQPSTETVSVPRDLIEADELIYRVVFAFGHVALDSYVIVELRDTAKTAELALAIFEGNIYVGHWWAKHGTEELRQKKCFPT